MAKPRVWSPLTGTEGERRLLAGWAAGCAERVLPLFEGRHPDDRRLREAVSAARAFARGEIKIGVAHMGSHALGVPRFAAERSSRVAAAHQKRWPGETAESGAREA